MSQPSASGPSLLKTGGTFLSAVALSTQLLATPVLAAEQESAPSNSLFDGRRIASSKANAGITTNATITPSIKTNETPYGKEQKLTGGTADLSLEKDGLWRLTLGGYYNADNTKGEMRLATSMSLLYAASKLGTYVSYEKGKDFDKFLVSEGFKVPGGKVLVTGALLKRLVEVSFSDVNKTYTPRLEQKAVGVDYTAGFSKDGLIEEVKTSLVFFDVDGKNLGSVGSIVLDTPTTFEHYTEYGGVRGGTKLLGEATIALRLAKWLRADLGAGGERRQYDAMYDRTKDTKASAVGTAKLTFQPNENHRLRLSGSLSDLQRQGSANYTIDFGYYLQAFVEGSYNDNRQGMTPERRLMAGFTITLDSEGKKSKLAPLFTDLKERDYLKLPDLVPSGRIVTNQIEVMERVAYRVRDIAINKAVLPAGSTVDPATGNILQDIVPALGFNNITLNGAPFTNTGQFSIDNTTNQLVIHTGSLAIPAVGVIHTYIITIDEVGGGQTIVNLQVEHGSVMIRSMTVTRVGTPDTTPPVTGTAPAISVAATATTVSVTQTINENGTGYYLMLPAASAEPSANTVVTAGTSFTMTGGVAAQVNITGLAASTAYKYYFVAKDTAGNTQAAVSTGLAITTTAAEVAPVMGDVPDQTYEAGSAITNLNIGNYVTLTNGDAITAYTLTGILPTGLSFNSTTGVLSGTPTQTGTFNMSVTATDNDGVSNSDSFSITVSDTTPPAAPTGLLLDGGAASTTQTTVTLDFTSPADAAGWFVSESSSVPAAGAAGWQSTMPTAGSFSAGSGTKQLCVFVKDATGNVQATPACDTIDLI